MTGSDDRPDSDGSSFIERWSRRKRAALDPQGPGDGVSSTPNGAADGEPGDPANEADLRPLPSIDDLTADGDLTAFLEKRVPEELRRLAMRRMWALDPQIRDFIEMAENQYDWNVPGGVPGFGDLAPGTDMDALLAQATGALNGIAAPTDDATATAVAATDVGREEGVMSAGPYAEAKTESETDSARLHEGAPTAKTDGVNSSQIRDDAPESSRSAAQSTEQQSPDFMVRRHGGALPV